MATQKQRSDSTRSLLLKAFRASLLRKGLERTTTQGVLLEIGLSKGAMYHHFRSKTEIVEAIYTEESRAAIERAFKKAEQNQGPLVHLKSACMAWTAEVRVPSISKILFEIGPTALGPEKAKAIENAHSLSLIEGLLETAIVEGEIGKTDPKLIASYLNALVEQTALHYLRRGEGSLDLLDRSIEAIFDSLRA